MSNKRTLYVKRTNRDELGEMWGDKSLTTLFRTNHLYVRCTKNGTVTDWNKTPVYTSEELIEKNNIIICK